MSVSKLATALTVTFAVAAAVFLLLFILLRRRRQTPISPAKHLLNLFCLKPKTRVEPSGPPTPNPPGSSSEDPVIDVFKLLEANGPSRILCTIKEDDSEYNESTISGETEKVTTLRVFLESELAAEKADVACDSPMFYTPVGSPSREEVGCPVTGDGCVSGPVKSSYDR